MKKKPTSNEGAATSDEAAASAPTVTPVEETSPFITPQMASCSMFAGDPTSVTPEDEKK